MNLSTEGLSGKYRDAALIKIFIESKIVGAQMQIWNPCSNRWDDTYFIAAGFDDYRINSETEKPMEITVVFDSSGKIDPVIAAINGVFIDAPYVEPCFYKKFIEVMDES